MAIGGWLQRVIRDGEVRSFREEGTIKYGKILSDGCLVGERSSLIDEGKRVFH